MGLRDLLIHQVKHLDMSKDVAPAIDYLLISPSSADRVVDFRILYQQPKSSHSPLVFHFKLITNLEKRQQGIDILLDYSWINNFCYSVTP